MLSETAARSRLMRRLQAIALVTTPLALRLTSAIEPTAVWYRYEQAQDVHILAAHPPHYVYEKNMKVLKEIYNQLYLSLRFGDIRTMNIHKRYGQVWHKCRKER